MNWSPQQQGMLAAMGYTLLRRAGAVTAAETAVTAGAVSDGAAGDRLMAALQRAAGGRDLSGLSLPPLEVLRAQAAAKRALWPALRALRRR